MTAQGMSMLEDELRTLRSQERPAVIRAIAEAREHGDLSENAEYHAARERQSFIEGRIAELEDIISRADDRRHQTIGRDVRFGAIVLLADEDTDVEVTYQIVGPHEADLEKGRISIASPLARALIGKEAGDTAEVMAPGGVRSYEVVDVRFS